MRDNPSNNSDSWLLARVCTAIMQNMPSLCLITNFQGVSGNEGLALALVTLDDLVERRKDTYGVVGDPSKYIVWMPVQG